MSLLHELKQRGLCGVRVREWMLISLCFTMWTVYTFSSVGHSFTSKLNPLRYLLPDKQLGNQPTSLQYELARYNVEQIVTQYLKYARAELQYVMNSTSKHGKMDTNLTDELLILTRERSTKMLDSDIRKGRIKQSVTSLRRQIYNKLLLVKDTIKVNSSVMDRLIDDTKMLESILETDLEVLSNSHSSTSDDWKIDASRKLGKLVQSKIETLQFPVNCQSSRLAYCRWGGNCGYGFGCQLHHATYCLLMAFSLNRTLIFDSKGWRYPGTWDTWFRPLTSCTNASVGKGIRGWISNGSGVEQDRVIEIKWMDHHKVKPEPDLSAIPEEIADEIHHFNRYPIVWWIGQFVQYVLRPNTVLAQLLDNHTHAIGFKHPIVGVHVRRTDKLKYEAKAVQLDHYMTLVSKWYDDLNLTSSNVTRRVFLATDEPDVVKEALSNYPGYHFIRSGYMMNAERANRTTMGGWSSIILDLFFLSRANYTVCTLSSNIGRAVYEMMQEGRGDGSDLLESLDRSYYYSTADRTRVKIIVPHKALRPGERNLILGEQIFMVTDHLNGYSTGRICETGWTATFPTFKARYYYRKVKFPVSFHGVR